MQQVVRPIGKLPPPQQPFDRLFHLVHAVLGQLQALGDDPRPDRLVGAGPGDESQNGFFEFVHGE